MCPDGTGVVKKVKLKHLDLFSGIGGFALAARWAGFETIQFVEYEPYAQKVLAKNFPGVPIAGDIFGFDATKFLGVGLVTGGFPCQPFSVAGKQLGNKDDRAIWPQMLRVIREARPTWVIGENVSGIIKMELDNVLSDLEGEGYTTQTLVIPAAGVDAKHRRERVWILAHTTGTRRSGGEGCMETDGCNLREEVQTRLGTSEDVAHSNNSGPYQSQVNTTEEGVNAQRGIGAAANADHDEVVNVCGEQLGGSEHAKPSNDSEDVAHSNSKRGCLWEANREDAENVREPSRCEEHRQWLPEPSVGRVVNGVPGRVDRLKGLGNAIVPQVAYEIMRCLK
jgi:DNA (cytosine-5)-methyltransferase 1